MKPVIQIKRIYENAARTDGYRVLVDGLWPRGFTKEKAAIDEWAKELAPTAALRQWFNHDPEKWTEFKKRYKTELKKNNALESFLQAHSKHQYLTLVFAGKDAEHTHALVLKEVLEHAFSGS